LAKTLKYHLHPPLTFYALEMSTVLEFDAFSSTCH
jgi:hypothetical protein